jgi:hypothetical protein
MNESIDHGGFAGGDVLNPIGLAAVIVLGLAVLVLPRKLALVPVCIMACFVAPGQRVILLGATFQLVRLLVLIGWFRVLVRREFMGIAWGAIDKLMFAWMVAGIATFSILHHTTAAFVWRLGNMYDTAGMYFFCRCVMREWRDVDLAVRALMLLSFPVAVAFLIEHATGRNAFAIFGGVPAITVVRDGRLRCQGAFAHPIVAGSFWACLLPLMGARWWRPNASRLFVIAAIAASLLIIVLCASSTPVATVVCCVVGALMFRYRYKMRTVRWGLLFTLIALHLVMKSPVWSLLARIDFAGGSTGYYRYVLVDSAIRRFTDWWLLGALSVQNWNPLVAYQGDICNEFVIQAVRGGLLTLVLYCAVLVAAYRKVGVLWRAAGGRKYEVIRAWSLGVALFCHTLAFFGISYFGQMSVVWYMLLAAVSALRPLPSKRRAHFDPRREPGRVTASVPAVPRPEFIDADPPREVAPA